jgi:hypothetical protein
MITVMVMLKPSFWIGLAIFSVFVLISSYLFFRNRHKKVIEPEPEKESPPPGLGDYEEVRYDENLYQSLMNSKVQIREVRLFNSKKEIKDNLAFASSLPFNFTGEDKRALLKLIPELIDVSVANTHELILCKSAAANFSNFKKEILIHLFIYLNRKYAWMKQATIISFHYIENNKLNCHMRYMTRDHVRLGILLGDTPGVINWLHTVGQMEEKDTCQFDIQKELGIEWDELLLKIKKVFEEYFTGGVEFIGPN